MREDWVECEFSDVLEIISGKNQKQVVDSDGKYPIYGSGGIIGKANDFLCESGTTIIGRKGTINSPIYVRSKFWNVDTAFGLSPLWILNNRLLFFFSVLFNFKALDKSTAVPSLAKRDLLRIKFPLPPIPIQTSIVAKIEELFSSLDSGIADLKKAQVQLVIYRQAVLKKAFEGAYSQRNTDKEIATINGLQSALPKNWNICKIGDIARLQGGFAFKSAEYTKSGIPIVKIRNVHYQDIDWSDKTFIDSSRSEEFRSYSLNVGDVLIAMTRPVIKSLNNIKTVVVKKSDLPALLNQRVGRFIMSDKLDKDYLKYFIFTDFFKRRVLKESSSSQQPNISSTKIEKFDFILPETIQEQHQIVQEIESRLSVCDKLEVSIKESLEKAEALRQSILKKAFEGKLLSAAEIAKCKLDKDYEPASVLLERIKKEKH